MHTTTNMNLKIIMLSKGSQAKKLCTIWFHVYKIPESVNEFI